MKILVLTSRFPYPLEKGDKLRIFYQIRELHHAGYSISLISLTEEPIKDIDYQQVKKYCQNIYIFPLSYLSILKHATVNILRGVAMPFQVSYFYNTAIKKSIDHIIEELKPDHIHCHLIRMMPYVLDKKCSKSLDFMDAFGAGTQRRAEISKFLVRFFWQKEAQWMLRYEKLAAEHFDFLTVISEQDRLRLPLVEEKPKVSVVSNGVDVDFFNIENYKNQYQTIEKKYDLCFVGNLGYYSNIEAVRFLVKKIVPLLKDQKPDIKILLAGARPTTEIKHFEDSNIKVVGWLDDIRQAYAESHILVAPLMHGIGQQNKILEAMAMGLPVVTTSRVNNAIGSVAGKDILLADTEGVFALHILSVLQDIDFQKFISENGRNFVNQNFGWTATTKSMVQLLERKIVQKRPN
ncbi:MAG: glycosyltransferase [Saprospiraceae bacterium]|nr:glycosyltransferase [Saprospiraceae bacterium]